jgi:hypothetical protein
MRSQFQLVVLLGVIALIVAQSPNPTLKEDDKTGTLKRAQDPRFNKMINLPSKGNSIDVSTKKVGKSSMEKSKDDSGETGMLIKCNMVLSIWFHFSIHAHQEQ